MTPEEEKRKRAELLDFYRSQEQRLRTQLRRLEQAMAMEATAINRKMAGSQEIRQALRSHGVSDRIISQCKFTASKAGVVVEFPRAGGRRKGQLTLQFPHDPFTKPTLAERRPVFAKVDAEIAELEKKVLDNGA
jgi:hypothetical protein